MTVQALHTGSRSTHATTRTRTGVIGRNERVAFGAVTGVSRRQLVGIDLGFGSVDSALGFETTHGHDFMATAQPVERGHRSSVVEQRMIADHDWNTIGVADHHLETATGWTTQ